MQKTFINYKDIIDSYEAINKDFGILPNGLYRGFDSIEKTATGIRLLHNQTGATYTQKDGTQAHNIGVIKSPQGVIITEDEPIELPISAHTILGDRIDVIVMEHQRGDIQGGSVAIPSVIQGALNGGVPIIASLEFRTIIGYLLVTSSGTYHYTRAITPALANFDLREQANKWRKQQTLNVNESPLSIIDNRISIDNTANTYYIKANSASPNDTQLAYVSTRKTLIDNKFSKGTHITLVNKGDFAIHFLNAAALTTMGITTPPTGYAFIDIPTLSTNGFKLQPGGAVTLLEDTTIQEVGTLFGTVETLHTGIWRILSMIDNFTNPYDIATDLKNKPWGDNYEFVEAVKEAIAYNPIANSKRSAPLSISDGVIQNGAKATHLNISEVFVQAGVSEITGVQTAFAIGTKVTLLFTVTEPFAIVRQGVDIKGFKSPIGFDYEVRTGSVIECVQMSTGLHVLSGEPYINWVSPAILGSNNTVLANQTVKYAVYPNGVIQFKGIAQLSGNGAQLSFKIPSTELSTEFRSPLVNKGGLFNFVTIPPHVLPSTKYHSMIYTEEMTEGFNPVPTGFFVFTLALSNTADTEGISEIDFNLTGVNIQYK